MNWKIYFFIENFFWQLVEILMKQFSKYFFHYFCLRFRENLYGLWIDLLKNWVQHIYLLGEKEWCTCKMQLRSSMKGWKFGSTYRVLDYEVHKYSWGSECGVSPRWRGGDGYRIEREKNHVRREVGNINGKFNRWLAWPVSPDARRVSQALEVN